jgi:hypothetical protein
VPAARENGQWIDQPCHIKWHLTLKVVAKCFATIVANTNRLYDVHNPRQFKEYVASKTLFNVGLVTFNPQEGHIIYKDSQGKHLCIHVSEREGGISLECHIYKRVALLKIFRWPRAACWPVLILICVCVCVRARACVCVRARAHTHTLIWMVITASQYSVLIHEYNWVHHLSWILRTVPKRRIMSWTNFFP